MFEIPTGEQWRTLFAVADQVRQAEYWKKYPEEMIFCFEDENQISPFYVTVHGHEEEVLGVSVYKDRADIKKYLKILAEGEDVSFQTIIANQSCVSVLFGAQDQLGPGDYTAMELAGYKPSELPRGNIYFRSYRPGATPWYIGSDEVALLTKGLGAFIDAAKLLGDETIDVAGESVLCRRESGKTKVSIVEFDESLREGEAVVVKDDFYVARLKRLKRNGRCLEVDICYMSTPVGSNVGPQPFFPKLCLIADTDQGIIGDQCIFEEIGDENEAFFEFIAQYLIKNGLPRKINMRRSTIAYLLSDLCQRLNITLTEQKELAIIDDFLNMVGGFAPEE